MFCADVTYSTNGENLLVEQMNRNMGRKGNKVW